MTRLPTVVATAASVVTLIAGCVNVLDGKPVAQFDDPFHVAGMLAVDGPSGLRPDAFGPTRQVTNTDGGRDDVIAANAVSDVEEFWTGAFTRAGLGQFKPMAGLLSWDAAGADEQFCGERTRALITAAYCRLDDVVGWERGELLPTVRSGFGDMGIAFVLAHEYGHAIQSQARLTNRDTPVVVLEQQADCFAGTYIRTVAENTSTRFTLSTGDGLNTVLTALVLFGTPATEESDSDASGNDHGTAFERISAFQFGFTGGIPACKAIDADEVTRRRGNLPVALQQYESGEWPVSEDSVRKIVDVLTTLFHQQTAPALVFDSPPCPDAQPSPPVSYCPATNTISVDEPALAKMGTRSGAGPIIGDYTAYSALVSRFMLAVQHRDGALVLDTPRAALRTACLTGVATGLMSRPTTKPNGDSVQLTAGDLDEAVSGILTNGLAASDVNGKSVPSGFSRIDAFRSGVLGQQDSCLLRFP